MAKKTKQDNRAALVDELGELDEKLAAFAADLKRRDALRKTVREWPVQDKLAAASTVAYRGARYLVALGPRENERSILSIAKVRERFGLEWLIDHCKVTLKDLEAKGDTTGLLTEAQTGTRPITIAKAAA